MADLRFNLIPAGADTFIGGQDASKIPDRISDECYAAGVNVSVRRASIQPRWGFERVQITFPDEVILDPFQRERSIQSLFEGGKFQALATYYIGDYQYIIIVVSGIIYALNPDTFNLVRIPIADGTMLNPRAARINWTAAGKYLVLYDYPANPVIVDGFSARRSVLANMEIPVSTQGAFNENRLFVANNGSEFTAGDPVGNPLTPTAPLTFEEVMTTGSPYLGQIFQVPTSDHNDPITYMGFLQVSDTSTGIGPLIIGTERSVYTFATQNTRDQWDQGQFGSLLCYNAGIAGPRAFCNVNSDAFFLSPDGYVRSLAMSRDEQRKWARVPVSREVENWFKYWDRDLIQYAFAGTFNNKIFFSVNPYRMSVTDYETMLPIADYAHGGMAVMELDSLTSFGEASKPVWAGLWTGVNPMDMVTLGNRAFIISKDETNINRFYEINPSINHDTDGSAIRFVRSRIYTKEYDFNDPFLNKEIHSVDFNFDSLRGDFEIDIKYKPSHSPCFIPWRSFKHTAPWRICCPTPDGCILNGFAPHHIRDFTIGAPNDDLCNPITNDFYKIFRKLQLMLTLTGKYWEIHEVRIKALPRQQSEIQTICDSYPTVTICDCCTDDWYVGPFKSCTELAT